MRDHACGGDEGKAEALINVRKMARAREDV